jgi:hypothetical protein
VRADLKAQQAEQQIDASFEVGLGEHHRQAHTETEVRALLRSDRERAANWRR